MRYIKQIFAIIIASFIVVSLINFNVLTSAEDKTSLNLTGDELNWIENNKNKVFTLGISPSLGIENFKFSNETNGFMEPLIKRIYEDLGINIKLDVNSTWNEVYSKFQNDNVDILYGANVTSERQQFMVFTAPLIKMPYAIIAKKDGSVQTIGDMDKKRVGFAKNDFVIDKLPELYKNITYEKNIYSSKDDAINALRNNEIDAYITTGGTIIYDYIYKYPELSYAFKINNITSDMTLSAKKQNSILIGILNKEIVYLQGKDLPEIINKAQTQYNLKIINLTDSEKEWLFKDGAAVIGVAKDYLPFDYYDNGKFKGIEGNIVSEISKMTGIKFKYDYDNFDSLIDKLYEGKVDILTVAKTEERSKKLIITDPYFKEREIIVGRREEKDVNDIFGLEGKNVAVVKGFWHNELLTKNLTKVNIIETNNIAESMKLVNDGKADYFIESPSVVKYYIEDLQYYDLIEKGTTSADSYSHFGVSKDKPELAAIINKILPMMDINELVKNGYEDVPHSIYNQKYIKLCAIIGVLIIILIVVIFYLIKLLKSLTKEKTARELLKQRERLLSIDSLTELHNRNYLNRKIMWELDNLPYPQVLIIADLNDLKIVNDTYGHHNGDLLIKSFSKVLKEICMDKNKIFRIGGDEFCIILTGTSEDEAIEIIKNINLKTDSGVVILEEGNVVKLSAALGYSIRYSKELSFKELFKTADANMYNCKKKYKESIEKDI